MLGMLVNEPVFTLFLSLDNVVLYVVFHSNFIVVKS